MRGLGTAFWLAVLAIALGAIGLGFAGGATFGAATAPRTPTRAPFPAPEHETTFDRLLSGPHSLDAADTDDDRYGDPDRAVAGPLDAPGRAAGVPRIALVVVDADRSATALIPFAAEPFPLAVLVTPEGTDTLRAARDAGKIALVDCTDASIDDVVALRRAGASGIACSTASKARARALVAANGDGLIFDDALAGDALARAGRAAHRRVVRRDVIADARADEPYVDFLLTAALAIARRTGHAAVIVHARAASRRAVERFAGRIRPDDARLVDLATLAK